jgi:hypothetical protein
MARVESETDSMPALQPARDIGNLTIGNVVAALDDIGDKEAPLPRHPEMRALSDALARLRSELDRSPANRRITDI